jgi:type II secretory ATPase GspE/PulE/Tfp pilus assembly ATPase PilB-like protein
MNKQIEQVVLGGEISEYKMREIAAEHGMVTMAQDGLLKALDKITSVEEVFGVAE